MGQLRLLKTGRFLKGTSLKSFRTYFRPVMSPCIYISILEGQPPCCPKIRYKFTDDTEVIPPGVHMRHPERGVVGRTR